MNPTTQLNSNEVITDLSKKSEIITELNYLIDQKNLIAARENFISFCEYVIKDEKTGEKVKLADIHRAWINHMSFCQKYGIHCLILAPMGHGKTQIMSIALPLYLLGKNPKSRIKLVCLSDDAAKERLMAISDYIKNDEDLKNVFPNLIPKSKEWTKRKISIQLDKTEKRTFAKDASLDAKGVTSAGIGGRCDYLLVDDIFDYRTAIAQPSMRQQIIDTFNIVWMTRIEPGHGAIIICTRWHQEDLAGVIMNDQSLLNRYGILIQAIDEDFEGINMTALIPDNLKDEYQKLIPGFKEYLS